MIDQKESTSTRAHNDNHSPEQGAQSISWLFVATLTIRLMGGKKQITVFCYILDYSDKVFCCTSGTGRGWQLGRILNKYYRSQKNVDKPWLFFFILLTKKADIWHFVTQLQLKEKTQGPTYWFFSLFFCPVIWVAGKRSYLLPHHFIFGRWF